MWRVLQNANELDTKKGENVKKQNDDVRMQNMMSTFAPGSDLLLHVCCAPCASRALERLSSHFALTLLYYNPNIQPNVEYEARLASFERLVTAMPAVYPVRLEVGPYDTERFLACARPFAHEREGGNRCSECFALRLEYTAEEAQKRGFACFASSLSVGPRKNAAQINAVGEKAAEKKGGVYLPSDFKKQHGYQRSVELSRELGLYRQHYCGCVYSMPKPEAEGDT